MNDDFDPFAAPGGDRTVLRPNPGGRTTSSPPQNPSTSAPPTTAPPPSQAAQVAPAMGLSEILAGASVNPLLDAAALLLRAGASIRQSLTQADAHNLRQQLLSLIKQYEQFGTGAGYDSQTVLTGRYLLCTFLDEAVTSTPWGAEGQWTQQTLLSTCHNETWGGEKFFQIIELKLRDATSPDLLELASACLLLGFEGKFAVIEHGRQQLDQVIDQLYATVHRYRGDIERDLSPHWRGSADSKKSLMEFTPNWVIAAVAGAALLLVFTGYTLVLEYQIYPVKDRVEELAAKVEPAQSES